MGVEQGDHVFHRVVGLEVGRPVGDEGVANAVRLVEGVTGEWLYEGENLVCEFLVKPLGQGACYEPLTLLLHYGRDLLAHGLPHYVRLAQAVPGNCLHDEQHLILVYDDAVRLFQDLL